MSSRNVLCASCSQKLNNSKDIYAITKCGHTYHGDCLEKILYKKTCSICHINYSPHQCIKLKLCSSLNEESDEESYMIFKYEWMYFDEKTDLKETESSECLLKIGTDPNNDNKNIYAARVFHKKHILAAYFVPPKSAIAIYDGHVYDVSEDVELLDVSSDDSDFYEWVQCTNNRIPVNAFDVTELLNEMLLVDKIGSAGTKEKQYIARGEYEGKILYGQLSSKENDENNFIYLVNGKEVLKSENISDFNCEVLVRSA